MVSAELDARLLAFARRRIWRPALPFAQPSHDMDNANHRPERCRIGELCEVFIPPPHGRVDGPTEPGRVIHGADLFQQAVTPSVHALPSALRANLGESVVRPGDVLIPRVTRRPCARLAGPTLEGCFPHNSIIVIRPRAGGPSPQALAAFFSSPRILDALREQSSLRDTFRFKLSFIQEFPLPTDLLAQPTHSTVAAVMDQLVRNLIRVIAEDQRELGKIEWRLLEHVVATACEALGFDIELTPPGKDGGKDVILTCWEGGTRRTYAVEIKHWTSGKRVPGSTLRKFLEVLVTDKFDLGLFLSTSGYGASAVALQHLEHRRLRVAGAPKVTDLCRMYVMSESGLWLPQRSPTELLLEGTTNAEAAHYTAPPQEHLKLKT